MCTYILREFFSNLILNLTAPELQSVLLPTNGNLISCYTIIIVVHHTSVAVSDKSRLYL